MNSFIGLWPYLKNGGIYVIEDMTTVFDTSMDWYYKDQNESAIDIARSFLVLLNKGPAHFMPVNDNLKENFLNIFKTLYHFDSYNESFVFYKKP